MVREATLTSIFLSTPSARRATGIGSNRQRTTRFLSTPSARRATFRTRSCGCLLTYFYPRPPRGGRLAAIDIRVEREKFLSTPSARRATYADQVQFYLLIFLSTPSARRATLLAHIIPHPLTISIHALREEGDRWIMKPSVKSTRFLSTPSARRATSGICIF